MARWTGPAAALALAIPALAGPPPDGDECETAIPIGPGAVLGTTTDNTGAVDNTTCAGGDIVDEWYVFCATGTGPMTVSTCGPETNFDTTLAVFSPKIGCFELIEDGCNDDFCGLQSLLTVQVTSGLDYYIRVSGWNGATGDYQLLLTREPDACASCTFVGEGTYVDTTVGSPNEGNLSSCGPSDLFADWFCYTASCSGMATADTCGAETDFQTTLAVYGSCGGSELACSDDACGEQSSVTWPAVAGETYHIRVSGEFVQTGIYELTIDCAATPGDECETCFSITEGGFVGTTADNTGTRDDTSCEADDEIDEWFCYEASCTGIAVADVCEADFNASLGVFGSCAGGEIACTIGCEVTWAVTAGTTYSIRVSGALGQSGSYQLHVGIDCAGSALEYFENEGAFTTAIDQAGYALVAFEGFEDGMVSPGGDLIDDPLDESTDNAVFDPGDIEPGLTFQSNVNGPGDGTQDPVIMNGMIVVPANLIGAPDVTVFSTFLEHSFDIVLDPPRPALALNLYGNIPDRAIEVRLFGPGGTPFLGARALELNGNTAFLGVLLEPALQAGESGVGVANIYSHAFGPSFGSLEGLSGMQAYVLACPGDATGDGVVNVDDLVAVITSWGSCPGPEQPCLADFDHDGVVEVDDLVAVIVGWGSCR